MKTQNRDVKISILLPFIVYERKYEAQISIVCSKGKGLIVPWNYKHVYRRLKSKMAEATNQLPSFVSTIITAEVNITPVAECQKCKRNVQNRPGIPLS